MAKGRNTFEGYQEAKQERRETLIAEYLTHLGATRVKFPHVTALADMVAMHIANLEQRPCNKATLLRNRRYKSLLLTFMAARMAGGTNGLKLKDVTDEAAKALVATAQLETSNLRRDVQRLRAYVSQLEKKQTSPLPADDKTSDELRKTLHVIQLKYTRACQALHALLQHSKNTLSVDMERMQIIDMARLRNNVVVDAEIAGPFFEWLASLPGPAK